MAHTLAAALRRAQPRIPNQPPPVSAQLPITNDQLPPPSLPPSLYPQRFYPPSNIIHLLAALRCEFIERVTIRLLLKRIAHLAPHLVHALGRLTFLRGRQLEQLSLDHAHNIQQRNLLRRTRQRITALLAAPARDEPAVAQLAQNLHQIVRRHRLDFREPLDVREIIPAMQTGELGKDTTGIINFNGKLHCGGR
jgi:hypothetical protein